MAKVYSHSESRAKGSVGMTTYRYVRGKVIQSQKIAPWDPSVDQVGNATRWNPRTALLGLISLFSAVHAESIKVSFNRTRGGSQRNYFMKRNFSALREALADLAVEYANSRVAPSIQSIEDAIGSYAAAHPGSIYRIKKTGLQIVFLSGNWDDSDDPAPAAVVSAITSTLNENYELTSIQIVGSNLNQSIKFKVAGAEIDGSMVIAEGGESAVFTPANPPLVVGTQYITASIGSRLLKSVSVEGDPREYFTLSLASNPAPAATFTGAGRYPAGSVVQITVNPAALYTFDRWSDGVTDMNRTVTINSDLTLTAEFTQE